MKKQELQQKFTEMSVKIKGLIKDDLIGLLTPLTHDDADYQYLRKTWKELEPEYTELVKARELVSEELWDNYVKLNINGLPEQKIFGTARKNFVTKLKEILGGKKHLEKAPF